MVFEKLNKEIIKWLESKGYAEASLAQKLAIPEIVSGEDVLIMAPTGYGKTLAAILPIFHKLLENKEAPGVRLLYITPLKSLNRNLTDRIVGLADKVGLSVDLRHGDTPQNIRKQQVEDPADVLVITPETLQSILIGKKVRELLRNVEYVVVDEIHELAENKRGSQLMLALERLRQLCGDFKRIGLSATIGDPEKIARFLTGGEKCKIIDAQSEKKYNIDLEYPKPTAEDLVLAKKIGMIPKGAYCMRRIKELVEKSKSTIVFVNTRETAESLGAKFRNWLPDFPIAVHHSSLSKEVRIDVENKFRDGKLKAIISTSSLELGIDIGSIDLVIQYGSPRQATKLVQRIGRSGHGIGKVSNGVVLCNSFEDYLEAFAIIKKARERWLEEPKVPEKPLDVLAQQIIGICIDFGLNGKTPTKKDIYGIVKRAYPYNNLTEEELESVIAVLRDIYLLGEDEKGYFRTKKGLLYYFENLSTIPNEKNYVVISSELNRRIGVLHQGFVAQYIKRGMEFIMKGEPWKVVEYDDEKITVVSSKNSESAIPSWEGELIPVPREIASTAADERETADFEELRRQRESFVVPTSRQIYIESYENYSIIHSCFGSKINETLSKVIGALISSKLGTSVGTRSDAYRIILKMPEYGQEQIVDALQEIEPEWIESILRKTLRNSSIFEFRFYQIAKRFGVIGKDATFSTNTISKLVDIYVGTPIFEETINELFRVKLDVNGAIAVIDDIRKGKIKVLTSGGYEISPIGIEGLDYTSVSLVRPKEKLKEIYELVHERLLNRKFWFSCLNCGAPLGIFAVRNVPDNLKCSSCGAKLIGFIPSKDKDLAKKVLAKHMAKEMITPEEEELFKRFSESAELFLNYGKQACYVIAGYGIGPTTAKRILKRYNKSDEELLRDIVDAERTFASNRQYWN
jgi:ATP-dependent Lhr-like helicase